MLIKGVAMSMSRLFVLPSGVKECECRNMKNAGKPSLVRNDLPIENKLANDDLTSGTVCAVKRGERKHYGNGTERLNYFNNGT